MTPSIRAVAGAIVALASTAAPASAQCAAEDFEGFAPGTVATNLVPGVVFTCEPPSCPGGPTLAEIGVLTGGPEGSTQAVVPRTGCPDFSPEALVLTFDENQSAVRFQVGVGDSGIPIRVRWFNEFGTPLGTRIYESALGTGLAVTIETGAPIIGRIEVLDLGSGFEFLDDLEFGGDETPPTVEIDAPAFDACVCGDATVGIVGSVDDPDGTYECDRLEIRPVNADPSEPWTEISEACGAFSGTLHVLGTTGLDAGRYYVRVTGRNACGLEASDVTVIRVDRAFGTLALDPVEEPLCGTVLVRGRAEDGCGVSWTLDVRPSSGGPWTIIAEGTGNVRCDVAEWDTHTVPDGAYVLRLRGEDGCGHTDVVSRIVEVANAGGCGCTGDPDLNGDGVVDFEDLLALLAAWG